VEGFEDIGGEKDGSERNSAPVNGYNRLRNDRRFCDSDISASAKTWGKHSTMASLSPSSIASCILSRLILVTSWQARPALLADSLAVPPEVVIDPENLTQTI